MNELEWIERERAVAIVRAPSREAGLAAARAAREGGVALIEITMNTPGALEIIAELARTGDAPVGAGTVLDAATADAALQAGARLIVSPHVDETLIAHVKHFGAVAVPGALTPTEVLRAWRAGADLVKIFPCASVGGPEYLKLLRGPLPEVRLFPTGGVTPANAAAHLDAGAFAVGLTGALFPADALASSDTDRIRAAAAALKRELDAWRSRSLNAPAARTS